MLFHDNGINKNFFYKHKHLANIDKVATNRIVLPYKDLLGKKGALNTLLDISLIALRHYL